LLGQFSHSSSDSESVEKSLADTKQEPERDSNEHSVDNQIQKSLANPKQEPEPDCVEKSLANNQHEPESDTNCPGIADGDPDVSVAAQ
jgi:hypothetical protein